MIIYHPPRLIARPELTKPSQELWHETLHHHYRLLHLCHQYQDDDEDSFVVFTSSRTPTTRKSLSILAIARGTESGWPNVLQASEVPQNQVILKKQVRQKQNYESHLRVGPIQSLILRHCALESHR